MRNRMNTLIGIQAPTDTAFLQMVKVEVKAADHFKDLALKLGQQAATKSYVAYLNR